MIATPVDLGALVREARERRGWTQTQLGARVGASRYWVAEFERGKAGVELGLVLRAVAAVGLKLRVDRPSADAVALAGALSGGGPTAKEPLRPVAAVIDLDTIVGAVAPRAASGVTGAAPASVRLAASPRAGPRTGARSAKQGRRDR